MSDAPARPRSDAAQPPRAAPAGRPRSPARSAGSGCPTRDALVDAAFAAALVTSPWSGCAPASSGRVAGRRRGRARARARHRPPRRRLPVAGRGDPGRPRGGLLPARRPGRGARPTSSAGCCPRGQTFTDLARTGRCCGWKSCSPCCRPSTRADRYSRCPCWRAARRRGHPRRRAPLGRPSAARSPRWSCSPGHRARHAEPRRAAAAGRGFALVASAGRRVRTDRDRPCRTAPAARTRVATGAVLLALAVGRRAARRPAPARHRRRRPDGLAHRAGAAARRHPVPQPAARLPPLHRAQPGGALRPGPVQGDGAARRAPVRFATLDAYDGRSGARATRSTTACADRGAVRRASRSSRSAPASPPAARAAR